jgi:GR25 family glycosyltransferase involved in LPS biosynthesis
VSAWNAFVVNLRGDAERWAAMAASLAPFAWLRLRRVEGVYGSALPDDVCIRLTNDPHSVIAKGALGCLLSHIRAWEWICTGDDPWALVLEDDARLHRMDILNSLPLPADVDIVFANDRTQVAETEPSSDRASGAGYYHSIVDSLRDIEKRHASVGADCYLISRNGASRLIDLFKKDGYLGHVDMRLLAYALDAGEVDELQPNSSWLAEAIKDIKRLTGPSRSIAARVLRPALAEHGANPASSRTREDQLGTVRGGPPPASGMSVPPGSKAGWIGTMDQAGSDLGDAQRASLYLDHCIIAENDIVFEGWSLASDLSYVERIDALVGNEVKASVRTERPRPDVLAARRGAKGPNCGFLIRFPIGSARTAQDFRFVVKTKGGEQMFRARVRFEPRS